MRAAGRAELTRCRQSHDRSACAMIHRDNEMYGPRSTFEPPCGCKPDPGTRAQVRAWRIRRPSAFRSIVQATAIALRLAVIGGLAFGCSDIGLRPKAAL